MIDSEDIINSVTAYLSEVVGAKSRINNTIDAVNTDKGDTLLPNVSNDIVLGQRSKDMNIFKNGNLNLDVYGETKFQSNYDAVAKHYTIEVSYVIHDNFSNDVFLKALRMERVITDVMQDYFKDVRGAGFMVGEMESSFTPERVLLGNSGYKAIKSGVVYNFILH